MNQAIKITIGRDVNGNRTLTASYDGVKTKSQRDHNQTLEQNILEKCEVLACKLGKVGNKYTPAGVVYQHSDKEYFVSVTILNT